VARAARVSPGVELGVNPDSHPGAGAPDGIPETARNQLAAILRRDADGLIAITTTD
jgi:hypothetical protein